MKKRMDLKLKLAFCTLSLFATGMESSVFAAHGVGAPTANVDCKDQNSQDKIKPKSEDAFALHAKSEEAFALIRAGYGSKDQFKPDQKTGTLTITHEGKTTIINHNEGTTIEYSDGNKDVISNEIPAGHYRTIEHFDKNNNLTKIDFLENNGKIESHSPSEISEPNLDVADQGLNLKESEVTTQEVLKNSQNNSAQKDASAHVTESTMPSFALLLRQKLSKAYDKFNSQVTNKDGSVMKTLKDGSLETSYPDGRKDIQFPKNKETGDTQTNHFNADQKLESWTVVNSDGTTKEFKMVNGNPEEITATPLKLNRDAISGKYRFEPEIQSPQVKIAG